MVITNPGADAVFVQGQLEWPRTGILTRRY